MHQERQKLKNRGRQTISGGDACSRGLPVTDPAARMCAQTPLHWCLDPWPHLPSPNPPRPSLLTGADTRSLDSNMLWIRQWPCFLAGHLQCQGHPRAIRPPRMGAQSDSGGLESHF